MRESLISNFWLIFYRVLFLGEKDYKILLGFVFRGEREFFLLFFNIADIEICENFKSYMTSFEKVKKESNTSQILEFYSIYIERGRGFCPMLSSTRHVSKTGFLFAC